VFEIGNTLREARVRRGLTLQQVEEDVKIRVKYVQAMENEDWDLMPGVTYAKGFLRTYSQYLGLDPDVVVEEFRSRGMVPSQEQHEPFGGSSIIGKPRSHRGRNTVVVVAVLCLVALAAIYVVGLINGGASQSPTTDSGALGLASPSPQASTTPVSTPSPTGIPAWRKNLVKIRAVKGDCWIEVRRNSSTGVQLFSGTLTKGTVQKFKGKDIWMNLGAPANASLNVEGKDVRIKSDVGPWPIEIIEGRVVQGSNIQG
jgi:transcriptional regulator with XRE-family HTH domain